MNEGEEGLLSFVMYWFLVFAARNAIIKKVRESDPDVPFASFPVLSREDINEKVRPLGENLIESMRDSGVPSMWTSAHNRLFSCKTDVCVGCTLAALGDNHELVEPLLEAQCQLKMERREARYTGSDA
jgi:hypothetical protein